MAEGCETVGASCESPAPAITMSELSRDLGRSFSRTTQLLFDFRERLLRASLSKRSRTVRVLGRLGYQILIPAWNHVRRGRWIHGTVYGRELMMPAEHTIVSTVTIYPHYNRALAVAAAVLHKEGQLLSIIDVGANIGETVAAIEELNPGRNVYLCVEPDAHLAEFCRRNHSSSERVFVKQVFAGERDDLGVVLEDDGRANPSTKFSDIKGSQKLHRLDGVAANFIEHHGVDLMKTDTEGYDFNILRSAESILKQHAPAVYFEWYPALLQKLSERIESIFEFLNHYGYRHWIFFTARGELHCEISDLTTREVEVLAKVALDRSDVLYFDVFGSTSETVTRSLTDRYLESAGAGLGN